jgi:hypothetical protein
MEVICSSSGDLRDANRYRPSIMPSNAMFLSIYIAIWHEKDTGFIA